MVKNLIYNCKSGFISLLSSTIILENLHSTVQLIQVSVCVFWLQHMLPAVQLSCCEMINKWDKLASKEGSCELHVCPYLDNLTANVISRTAFGSSYEEGGRIFQLQKELVQLISKGFYTANIPGWRWSDFFVLIYITTLLVFVFRHNIIVNFWFIVP